MTKAVISNRIYLNCKEGSELMEKLRTTLIYSINQMPVSEYPLIINNIIKVSDNVVSIPSGRLDLIPSNYTIIDKRCDTPANIPEPTFVPREDQAQAIAFFEGNGLLSAKPGYGKTVVGLGLAHKFQKKTLIIVTTTIIRDMWVAEVEKWFGIKCGIIGGVKGKAVFDIDSPIVVSNIQTLRNKAQELSSEFGLVILDETHRAPAKTFTDTLNVFRARIKIGLSGTLERKDGKHCVLPDYFGTDIYVGLDENRMTPEVHLWESSCTLSSNEFMPWATTINNLYANPAYKAELLQLANLYMDSGHIILGVSDRVGMLEYLHEATKDRSLIITGGVQNRQPIFDAITQGSPDVKGLWATQSIFSEGVSVNPLSCIILGTPLSNDPLLEQLVGRVQRKAPNKIGCVAVDIALKGVTGTRQSNTRKRFYVEKGWRIKHMGSIL